MAKPKASTPARHLTVAQKKEILQLSDQKVRWLAPFKTKHVFYTNFQVSQISIAKKFGCTQGAVSGIVKKKELILLRKSEAGSKYLVSPKFPGLSLFWPDATFSSDMVWNLYFVVFPILLNLFTWIWRCFQFRNLGDVKAVIWLLD